MNVEFLLNYLESEMSIFDLLLLAGAIKISRPAREANANNKNKQERLSI